MRDSSVDSVDSVASVASIGIALQVRPSVMLLSLNAGITNTTRWPLDSGVTFITNVVRFGRIVEHLEMETYSCAKRMATANPNYFIVKN